MKLINRLNYFVRKLIKETTERWKQAKLFSKSMNVSLTSSKLSNLSDATKQGQVFTIDSQDTQTQINITRSQIT